MKNTILVFGSLATDLMLEHDGSFSDAITPGSLDHLSVCFDAPRLAKAYGGNAGSVSWGLALLGERPYVVSSVGGDASEYLDFLREGGVDTGGVITHPDMSSATFVAGTDAHGRQIMFFHQGAVTRIAVPDLAPLKDSVRFAIAVPTVPAVTLALLHACADSGIPCYFDPGQCLPQFSPEQLREALALSAGVFVNAYEAGLLGKNLGLTESDVAARTPLLVITRGADGFVMYHDGTRSAYPRCEAKSVTDPTGAGDAFRAGFLAGVRRGWTFDQCGQFGAAVSSFCVEQRGVLMPTIDADAVYARAEKTYGERLPAL